MEDLGLNSFSFLSTAASTATSSMTEDLERFDLKSFERD